MTSPGSVLPRQSLSISVLALALVSRLALANSNIVTPLEKTPPADEVLAFASTPPWESSLPINQLKRDDLLLFLREGVRHGPEFSREKFSPEKNSENVWCTGVFFTREGAAYYWSLWDRQTLFLVTTDYRGCYLTLKTSSVQPEQVLRGRDEFRPLAAPTANDLRYFANADRPATGFQISRTKGDIDRFLRHGKVFHCTTSSQQFEIQGRARLTLPPILGKRLRGVVETDAAGRICLLGADLHVGGTLMTKDARVIFWEQWGDDVIQLSDSTGAECVLQIP